jgi:glycosyltransferase involved in cell wall biosynthesis
VTDPLISVLLPARDAGAFIAGALDSILRQREARFECLVVDDGSRDDTADIVRRFVACDERIRLISAPRNGLVAALERGRTEGRGAMVARMDADDRMHRDRLGAQLAALRGDSSLGAVGCHVRTVPRAGLTEGWLRYEAWLNGMRSPGDIEASAFVECPLAHPTLMMRRDVLDAHPYRETGWPEDYDLLLRWLAAGVRLGIVPRRLHLWRDRPDRTSRTDPRYGPDRFTACKAHHLRAGLLAGDERYILWGHGATGRALRVALEALGRRPSHIVEVHPGRLGQVIHGAPVIAPEALGALLPNRVVASVAGPDARRKIRAHLDGLGLVQNRDYIVAA